jgi:hypothetical protein
MREIDLLPPQEHLIMRRNFERKLAKRKPSP